MRYQYLRWYGLEDVTLDNMLFELDHITLVLLLGNLGLQI